MKDRHGRVRRRGSRWQVDAMVDGRRVRRAAASQEAAEEMLEELVGSEEARRVAPIGPTVSQILDRYLDSTRLHCRPRTIRTSEAAVKRLKAYFGDKPACELARTEVDRFSADRMAAGVGPHAPNRDLACLRAALTQAKDDGLIDRVPKIRMLRTVQALPKILTREQIRRLVEAGGELRPLLATAACAGLRAAELRWLWWEDVDLDEHEVHVRAKQSWRPKSHAERTVPIPKALIELLARHREDVGAGHQDWVFPVATHGGQWSETGLSHAARRIAENAKVWRAGSKPLHDLRRSWASHLLADGTPIDTVRRLGGWASNATLERFYLAPTESAIQRAVDASADILF